MASDLWEAIAEDLAELARLHGREIDHPTLLALSSVDFPSSLALLPKDEAGKAAYKMLQAAVEAITPAELDELAADYAAIYLSNRYGASPYESVWLDDDHLTCQQPMFELREIYASAGLCLDQGEKRYDDHLVFQLEYLRHQLLKPEPDLVALEAFMDEHIGYWLPDFAGRVAQFADTAFYAGLAVVTGSWLNSLRTLISDMTGHPIPSRDAITVKINHKLAINKADVAPIHFISGATGPSW